MPDNNLNPNRPGKKRPPDDARSRTPSPTDDRNKRQRTGDRTSGQSAGTQASGSTTRDPAATGRIFAEGASLTGATLDPPDSERKPAAAARPRDPSPTQGIPATDTFVQDVGNGVVVTIAGNQVIVDVPAAHYQRLEAAAAQLATARRQTLEQTSIHNQLETGTLDTFRMGMSLVSRQTDDDAHVRFQTAVAGAMQRRLAYEMAFSANLQRWESGMESQGARPGYRASEAEERQAADLAARMANYTREDDNLVRAHRTNVRNHNAVQEHSADMHQSSQSMRELEDRIDVELSRMTDGLLELRRVDQRHETAQLYTDPLKYLQSRVQHVNDDDAPVVFRSIP